MAALAPYPRFRAFDANGDPLAGGKVYFYEAGTTTPKDTYTDEGAGTPNANPVILDAEGYADIWGGGSYKIVLKDSNDATISTTDNIYINASTALASDMTAELTVGYTAAGYNAGTKTTGTFTPDPALGNMQYAVNGGAHTLAPPAANCTIILQYTNNASAGAITTSGFTSVFGSFTTTNGDDFICDITKLNGFSRLSISRLQ